MVSFSLIYTEFFKWEDLFLQTLILRESAHMGMDAKWDAKFLLSQQLNSMELS